MIVSTFGTLLGLALGSYLGWMLVASISSGGTTFAVPVVRLVIVTVLGAIAGVLAAGRPARRAARLPVLDAIATT
jgi:putative ABC transport system permease protein